MRLPISIPSLNRYYRFLIKRPSNTTIYVKESRLHSKRRTFVFYIRRNDVYYRIVQFKCLVIEVQNQQSYKHKLVVLLFEEEHLITYKRA